MPDFLMRFIRSIFGAAGADWLGSLFSVVLDLFGGAGGGGGGDE